MTLRSTEAATDEDSSAGSLMMALIRSLYPICRSITGDGVRQTLVLLQEHIPLIIHEVPSGTSVLDWTVPDEWNIRDAFVRDMNGERVIDFRKSNLHVLNYSVPVNTRMSLQQLKPHLYSDPAHPDWIPYRTSYYNANWGFCLAYNHLAALPDGEYDVVIDSTLAPGHLTYGELVLPGETDEEVLISCHTCHPSLCNDNLSGIAVAVALAQGLAQQPRRYTYRFLFIPGTIGSITWLAQHETEVQRIRHGVVLTCVGDRGTTTYKKTRAGNADIDRAFLHVLEHAGHPFNVLDFYPYGYDERQYNSPGFNLPVGVLMRSKHGEFPEYHTSADNLTFVDGASLEDSLHKCQAALALLDANRTYRNLSPKGEPQLGRRGIYKAIAGQQSTDFNQMALLWVLNLSDGDHSLLDIAERSELPFEQIQRAARLLEEHDLLAEIPPRDHDAAPSR